MPLSRPVSCILAAACAIVQAATAFAGSEHDVVAGSLAMIDELKSEPKLAPWRETLQRAEAIVVMPEVSRNAFMVGGDGGRGVLLARQAGAWSYPAFYTLGAGSVSPQAGNGLSKLVFVVMTKGGLEKLLADRSTLGGDLSIAPAPVGPDAGASKVSEISPPDVVLLAEANGSYGGLALTGAVLRPNGEANKAFYGNPAGAREIVVGQRFQNDAAEPLRKALPDLAGQRD
jgi:SH3 domain-containing YSC84-like protein 1